MDGPSLDVVSRVSEPVLRMTCQVLSKYGGERHNVIVVHSAADIDHSLNTSVPSFASMQMNAQIAHLTFHHSSPSDRSFRHDLREKPITTRKRRLPAPHQSRTPIPLPTPRSIPIRNQLNTHRPTGHRLPRPPGTLQDLARGNERVQDSAVFGRVEGVVAVQG